MNRKTLSPLGWDDRLELAYVRHDRPDRRPARVSRVERGVCTLLAAGGVSRASVGGDLLVTAARDGARLPCPGDWVVVRSWPDRRVTIEAVLPRCTTVHRPGGPPLASNVDIVVAVDAGHARGPGLVVGLRALAAHGRTLGLVGAPDKVRAALVDALAGATLLPPARGGLVPLPDGGAVIDAGNGVLEIDGVSFITASDVSDCPTGHRLLNRSAETD